MILTERFAFVHVPKTGGTSIARALLSAWPGPAVAVGAAPGIDRPGLARETAAGFGKHGDLGKLRTLCGMHAVDIARLEKILVVVRNPYDWEVSLFNFARQGRPVPGAGPFEPGTDFEAFARRGAPSPFPGYLRLDGTVPANLHVLRFESLADDFAQALRDLGIDEPPALDHLNRSHRDRDWSARYSSGAAEAVARRHRALFELGYYAPEPAASFPAEPPAWTEAPEVAVSGPVRLSVPTYGLRPDGQAGRTVAVVAEATADLGAVTVSGRVDRRGDGRLAVLSAGPAIRAESMAEGPFAWTVPVAFGPGDQIEVHLEVEPDQPANGEPAGIRLLGIAFAAAEHGTDGQSPEPTAGPVRGPRFDLASRQECFRTDPLRLHEPDWRETPAEPRVFRSIAELVEAGEARIELHAFSERTLAEYRKLLERPGTVLSGPRSVTCVRDAVILPVADPKADMVFGASGAAVADARFPAIRPVAGPPGSIGLEAAGIRDEIEAAVFLGPVRLNTIHYGHFTLETLARSWFLDQVDAEVPVIFHRGEAAWQPGFPSEMLGALGISPERIRPVSAPTRVRNLLVPEPVQALRQWTHLRAADHYRRMAERVLAAGAPGVSDQPLYLSRSLVTAAGRHIAGERAFERILQENGFLVVHPERLSWPEQVRLVNRHRHIFAPMGSAAHTTLFSLTSPVLHLFVGQAPYLEYLLAAAATGVETHFVECMASMAPSRPMIAAPVELQVGPALDYLAGEGFVSPGVRSKLVLRDAALGPGRGEDRLAFQLSDADPGTAGLDAAAGEAAGSWPLSLVLAHRLSAHDADAAREHADAFARLAGQERDIERIVHFEPLVRRIGPAVAAALGDPQASAVADVLDARFGIAVRRPRSRATRQPAPVAEPASAPELRWPYLRELAALHERLDPEVYLEIGVDRGASLALARRRAIGIDPAARLDREFRARHPNAEVVPMTSDAFFARHRADALLGGKRVGLAFIDGLHTFDQVLRDFVNVERWMSPDGTIAIHDVLPRDERAAARLARAPGDRAWCGDVWQLVPCLRAFRPDLALTVSRARPGGLLLVTNLDPGSGVLHDRQAEMRGMLPGDEDAYLAALRAYLADPEGFRWNAGAGAPRSPAALPLAGPAPVAPEPLRLPARTLVVSHVLPGASTGPGIVLHRLFGGVEPDVCRFVLAPPGPEPGSGESPAGRHAVAEVSKGGPQESDPAGEVEREAGRIAGIVRSEGWEAILAVVGRFLPFPAAVRAGELADVPVTALVLDHWSLQLSGRAERQFAEAAEGDLLRSAACVVAGNELLAGQLARAYGVRPVIVRNPVPASAIPEAPLPWPRTAGEVRLLYAGLIYGAQADSIARVAQALRLPGLERCTLTVHSPRSRPVPGTEAGDPRIVYRPFVPSDEVGRVLAEADIVVLPLSFGGPLDRLIRGASTTKLADCLASGRPLLVHAPPGSFVAWYVARHGCGLVVDVPDPGAVAAAVRLLERDAGLRASLTANALERARLDFSQDAARRGLEEALASAGRERRR